MNLSTPLKKQLLRSADALELQRVAIAQGMSSLRSGAYLAAQGITTSAEVFASPEATRNRLALFRYQAVTADGKKITKVIDADSYGLAKRRLLKEQVLFIELALFDEKRRNLNFLLLFF